MDKKIKLRPKSVETTTISLRLGVDLLKEYDELANKSGYSRNELINKAMQHFIDNVEIDK